MYIESHHFPIYIRLQDPNTFCRSVTNAWLSVVIRFLKRVDSFLRVVQKRRITPRCDFLAPRQQLHCVESSSTLWASARWTLRRINALLFREKPDSKLPAIFSDVCKLPQLARTCRPRRQKWVKRSWTRTMTERTKPPVRRRGMAASCSPPFSLSVLTQPAPPQRTIFTVIILHTNSILLTAAGLSLLFISARVHI